MDEQQRMATELAEVELLIGAITGRCADLENAVGVMAGLGADTAPADAALLATYHALGLHSRRRATLIRMLDSFRDGAC